MKTAVLMGAVDGTKLKNDQEKKHMQPKENKWKEQIRSLVITPNAILKSSILSVLWLAAGFALGLFYNYGISVIFIVVFLGILWLFPFWQPAFLLVYFIAGNRSISPRLEPYKVTRVYAISLVVRLAFLAYLVYVAVRMLLK